MARILLLDAQSHESVIAHGIRIGALRGYQQ
jgi:hypothetical protein